MSHHRFLPPRAAALALASALLASAPTALAQPNSVSCQALADWLRGYDMRHQWRPNGLTSGALQGHLFRDDVARVFGRPALEWTPAEARALADRAGRCAEEMQRGRVRGALGPMQQTALHGHELARYLALLAESRLLADAALGRLADLVPGLPLLGFVQALSRLADDGRAFEQLTRAAEALPGAERGLARDLVSALPPLPRAEVEGLSRRAAAELPGLVARFAEDARRGIAEAPGTREEVARLDGLARAVEAAAPAVLPRPVAAEIAARASARAAELRRVLADRAVAAVGALPASWQAAGDLARFRPEEWERPGPFVTPQPWQADLSALDAEGRARVASAVASRRGAMVEELLAGTLAAIGRARFLGEINAAVGVFPPPGAPPEAVRRIEQAALERARAVAEASLREIRREMAGQPASQASLDLLDRLLRDAGTPPPPWQAPWRPQVVEIIRARRAEIVAALDRQEAGSFAGRIYEGQGVRIEFLDARRAVVTRFGAATLVPVEEIGEGRALLAMDGRQVVATREGRRLVGLGPELLRVR